MCSLQKQFTQSGIALKQSPTEMTEGSEEASLHITVVVQNCSPCPLLRSRSVHHGPQWRTLTPRSTGLEVRIKLESDSYGAVWCGSHSPSPVSSTPAVVGRGTSCVSEMGDRPPHEVRLCEKCCKVEFLTNISRKPLGR